MEIKKAAFSFEKYRITSFSLKDVPEDGELIVQMKPTGVFYEKPSEFKLNLKVLVKTPDGELKRTLVDVHLEAIFKFKDVSTLEEIPKYFYANALAIVYPHIRGFITMLTRLANQKEILLPLANLSFLEGNFRKNTTTVQ